MDLTKTSDLDSPTENLDPEDDYTDSENDQEEIESFINSVNNYDGRLNPEEYNYDPSEDYSDYDVDQVLDDVDREKIKRRKEKEVVTKEHLMNDRDMNNNKQNHNKDDKNSDPRSISPAKSGGFLTKSVADESNNNNKKSNNKNANQNKKIKDKGVDFVDKNHAENLMSCFDDLRKKSLFTDVILDVASHEFPAHRVVLVSGSDYFKQMFCTDHRASKQMMIQITGLSADVMEMLLSYLYTSKIQITKKSCCMYQLAHV